MIKNVPSNEVLTGKKHLTGSFEEGWLFAWIERERLVLSVPT